MENVNYLCIFCILFCRQIFIFLKPELEPGLRCCKPSPSPLVGRAGLKQAGLGWALGPVHQWCPHKHADNDWLWVARHLYFKPNWNGATWNSTNST